MTPYFLRQFAGLVLGLVLAYVLTVLLFLL